MCQIRIEQVPIKWKLVKTQELTPLISWNIIMFGVLQKLSDLFYSLERILVEFLSIKDD